MKLTQTISRCLLSGKKAVLLTVLDSCGSTPGKPGAMMAVWEDGCCGTVGGGAMEGAAAEDARQLLRTGGDRVSTYELNHDAASDLGMVCGGSITLLLQTLTPADAPVFSQLARWEQEARPAWLLRKLEHGKVTAMEAFTGPEAPEGWLAFRTAAGGRAVIFGAGHIALALSRLLLLLDIPTVIFDDREEFANLERFPDSEVICGSFDRISRRLTLHREDMVFVLTRGHQADTEVLRQVLPLELAYLGCVGSRKKLALCRETLLQEGFTAAQWDRLHAPIGLDIGAKTPEEIAVAIAAELISLRAKA